MSRTIDTAPRISAADRRVLRDLARRVAEIAEKPVMAERRELWRRHNGLDRPRAMILVFPEGSWCELLTDDDLRCEGKAARKIEWQLRSRVYTHEHFHDDTVIEKEWVVRKVVRNSGWGIEAKWRPSTTRRGARTFDPVIHTPADLERIQPPRITVDEEASERNLTEARALFGDILDVRLKGVDHISFHLMSLYTSWRGLAETMMDMVLEPGMLHDAMARIEAGYHGLVEQYIEHDLLSLNNDGTYHSSGGNGYTDELPAADFDGEHVRPRDMWASAESQEMAQVSPQMHEEFVLQYERRLLAPFGLNGYGCCEDLTRKLDAVLTIPNIRRISISPWADVEACAEMLGGGTIFSWKPHPAHLAGRFAPDRIRDYIRHALDATRGCIFEMILKDTHTCDGHPERFDEWTRIARELVEEQAARAP